MADLDNVVDSLAEAIRDCAKYAEKSIENGISEVESLVNDETDEDFWERFNEGTDTDDDNGLLNRIASDAADIRYRTVEEASRMFREDGFEVYDSDLEAAFKEDLETLEWENGWEGLADAVSRY